jgi:hypothetical protein
MAALPFHTTGIERSLHAAPRGSADGGMVARATGCVNQRDGFNARKSRRKLNHPPCRTTRFTARLS